MKSIFTILIMNLMCLGVFAQNQILKGVLKDAKAENVAFATLRIGMEQQESIDKIADENGQFSIEVPPAQGYELKISAVGYKDTVLKLSKIPSQPLQIIMKEAEQMLMGVEVMAQRKKPLIERKIDRITMNISQNALATGKSSLQLLSLAPGVFVNQGVISINGVSGARVMINGKLLRLAGNELKNYLQNLRASDIESVEVIPNPPAEYEAEGAAGLVNIMLKKGINNGLNGDLGFDFTQGLGKYPGYNPHTNWNYKSNKWLFGANVGYNSFKNFQYITQSRSIQNNGKYESINDFVMQSSGLTSRFSVDYEINKQQNISLEYAYSDSRENDNTLSTTQINFSNAALNSNSTGDFPITSNSKNTNITLNYNWKTDDKGSKFSFISDYTLNDGINASGTYSKTFDPQGQLLADTAFVFYSPATAKIFTANVQYDWKIGSSAMFTFGGKSALTTINNANYYDVLQENVWQRPNALKFNYKYEERILAAFANLSGEFMKIQYKLGLRTEDSKIDGVLTGSQSGKIPRKYTNLFPNVFLKKDLDTTGMNSVMLSYNRRLNRPAYFELNPYKFYIDNYSVQTGNPNLNPSFTNKFALGFLIQGKYFAELSYSKTKDIINQVIENDPNQNLLTIIRKNTGESSVFAGTFSVPIQITEKWKTNNNLLLTYTHSVAPEFNIKRSNFIIETQQEYDFGKGWQANLTAFYSPRLIEGNLLLRPLSSVDISLQKKFLKNRLNASLTVNDVFYSKIIKADAVYNNANLFIGNKMQSRTAVFSLVYTFKKGKDFQAKAVKKSNEDEKGRLK